MVFDRLLFLSILISLGEKAKKKSYLYSYPSFTRQKWKGMGRCSQLQLALWTVIFFGKWGTLWVCWAEELGSPRGRPQWGWPGTWGPVITPGPWGQPPLPDWRGHSAAPRSCSVLLWRQSESCWFFLQISLQTRFCLHDAGRQAGRGKVLLKTT